MEAEQRAALEPVDVESFLSADLASETLPVSPPPVSESLGGSLPTAMVERNGGVRLNRVADQHDCTFSVWGATWASAMDAANALAGSVARLPDRADTKTQWRSVEISALPFNARDATHPDIPRVQFTASVICRTTT